MTIIEILPRFVPDKSQMVAKEKLVFGNTLFMGQFKITTKRKKFDNENTLQRKTASTTSTNQAQN